MPESSLLTYHNNKRRPTDDCKAGNPDIGSLTKQELQDGLADLTAVLSSYGSAYKHVLYDIQNEANLVGPSDGLLNATDVDEITEAIHNVDSHRIVTVSISGDQTPAYTADFADNAEVDVATWHERREAHWWTATASRVGTMRSRTTKPIYLQEPAPSGTTYWTLDGIEANVQAAKQAGAAAWCFHTRCELLSN